MRVDQCIGGNVDLREVLSDGDGSAYDNMWRTKGRGPSSSVVSSFSTESFTERV